MQIYQCTGMGRPMRFWPYISTHAYIMRSLLTGLECGSDECFYVKRCPISNSYDFSLNPPIIANISWVAANKCLCLPFLPRCKSMFHESRSISSNINFTLLHVWSFGLLCVFGHWSWLDACSCFIRIFVICWIVCRFRFFSAVVFDFVAFFVSLSFSLSSLSLSLSPSLSIALFVWGCCLLASDLWCDLCGKQAQL